MVITAQTLDRQKASLTPLQRELVEVTVEETSRMSQLADNLMNLARGNISSIPLQRARIEVAALLAETTRRFSIQAQEKHINLETRVEGAPVVNGDRVKLSWVISNLVGNALRYTPEGGEIVVIAFAGGTDLVRLEVADTGPGIPSEIRAHVFEGFAQYNAPGFDAGAAGLGLAIVKDIVEAHGGRISVESNNGSGSRFIVQLPAFQDA